MEITETTKPVERTFTIELTENQLKNLGVILGDSIPNCVKDSIAGVYKSTFPGIVYENTLPLYERIVDIFKTNK